MREYEGTTINESKIDTSFPLVQTIISCTLNLLYISFKKFVNHSEDNKYYISFIVYLSLNSII